MAPPPNMAAIESQRIAALMSMQRHQNESLSSMDIPGSTQGSGGANIKPLYPGSNFGKATIFAEDGKIGDSIFLSKLKFLEDINVDELLNIGSGINDYNLLEIFNFFSVKLGRNPVRFFKGVGSIGTLFSIKGHTNISNLPAALTSKEGSGPKMIRM